ncbi:MAG: phage holin family protein [Actinobacteria bacterium]|nr:phage holin family protein [Actinomycetota bacterium]
MREESQAPRREPTTRELAAQVAVQGAGLLGQELALAKAELVARARQAGVGATMLAVAGLLGGSAWLILLAAAVAGVAVALPVWASALIIGGALAALAGSIALIAGRRLARTNPPLPLTTDSLRRDVAEIRGRISR